MYANILIISKYRRTYILLSVSLSYVVQQRRKVPKCVCEGVGGGAHIHIIYVPLVKNQYKLVLFGYKVT